MIHTTTPAITSPAVEQAKRACADELGTIEARYPGDGAREHITEGGQHYVVSCWHTHTGELRVVVQHARRFHTFGKSAK